MVSKIPIVAERIRKVPRHFSWIDHRLVRHRHIESCSHAAATLYLFLVTVGDNLIRIGLIAWQKPLYQVLSLDRPEREKPAPRSTMDHPLSLGDILKNAREGIS
jgi:hypothetical protein